jgi:hypothetical protein
VATLLGGRVVCREAQDGAGQAGRDIEEHGVLHDFGVAAQAIAQHS